VGGSVEGTYLDHVRATDPKRKKMGGKEKKKTTTEEEKRRMRSIVRKRIMERKKKDPWHSNNFHVHIKEGRGGEKGAK